MTHKVTPVSPSFGSYQNILKTLYKRGKMPSVTRGLYGELLSPDNVSLEHLRPASWGGATTLSNLALATREANNARGSRPLDMVLTWEMLENYLKQFNFRVKDVFDGHEYQKMVKETCIKLGLKNPNEDPLKGLNKKMLRSLRNQEKRRLNFYA